MHRPHRPDSRAYPETLGEGVGAVLPVKVVVGATVDYIEAPGPHGYGEGQQHGFGVQPSGHGNPRRRRRNGQREAQEKMAGPGEVLGKGIEDHVEGGNRSQNQRKSVQLGRCVEEDACAYHGQRYDLGRLDQTLRNMPSLGPRVHRVLLSVNDAVGRHSQGSDSGEGHGNPDEISPSGPSAAAGLHRGQDHADVAERESVQRFPNPHHPQVTGQLYQRSAYGVGGLHLQKSPSPSGVF